MEQEIKKEEQAEVKIETNYDAQFKELSNKFDKLFKENEILKQEIISLKDAGVNVSPVVENKKHEVNRKLWKETF